MIRRENSVRKTIIVMTLAAMGFFALAGSRSAMAQTGTSAIPDTQEINYFSGGASVSPNGTEINVTDPLEATSTGQPQAICAMFYVFDNAERMQECCGCLITEDGLLTLAVNGGTISNANTVGSLVTNPVQGANPIATGVIRIVSAALNGENQHELENADDSQVCDATGGVYPYGQYGNTKIGGTPFNGGATWANGTPIYNKGFSPANSGSGASMTLIGNTRAWATHLTVSLTETAFHNDPLTGNDAVNLAETCGDVQDFGSGRGVCQCGSSD